MATPRIYTFHFYMKFIVTTKFYYMISICWEFSIAKCRELDFEGYTSFTINKMKDNDQEAIQSTSTSCPRHQMGKEYIQVKIITVRAES